MKTVITGIGFTYSKPTSGALMNRFHVNALRKKGAIIYYCKISIFRYVNTVLGCIDIIL